MRPCLETPSVMIGALTRFFIPRLFQEQKVFANSEDLPAYTSLFRVSMLT